MSTPQEVHHEPIGERPHPPDRWKQVLACLLAPTLLFVGVMVQRYHVHVHGQSAWSGGGFGMFSTVDVPDARMVRAYLVIEGERALILEPDIRKGNRRLYTRPSSSRLQSTAKQLIEREWRVYDSSDYPEIWSALPELMQLYLRRSPEWVEYLRSIAGNVDGVPPTPGSMLYPGRVAFEARRAPGRGGDLAQVEAVELEVWRPIFDISTDSLRWELVAAESRQATGFVR